MVHKGCPKNDQQSKINQSTCLKPLAIRTPLTKNPQRGEGGPQGSFLSFFKKKYPIFPIKFFKYSIATIVSVIHFNTSLKGFLVFLSMNRNNLS